MPRPLALSTVSTVLQVVFSASAILVLSPGWLVAAAVDRPNVVVILTDDQGYADISLNPHHPKEVSTPHMDALARGGVVFSQAYTSGNVCSPTRAGLMLGRYQQRVGVYSAGTVVAVLIPPSRSCRPFCPRVMSRQRSESGTSVSTGTTPH